MTQLAEPEELVVPLQDCAPDPVPRVKTTGWPVRGVPADGTFVVKTPESVTGCPFMAEIAPV
jgi:hypothetical protein